MPSENQMCRIGRCFWSNETIALVIQYWVCGEASISKTANMFDMSEEQVIKIIDTHYKPALTGDLMSITIPSKIN